jgi:type II secretory pathway component PulM
MNLTDREKLLLPIFPALLVFTIYAWGYGARAQSRMSAAQDELAAMEQDAAGIGDHPADLAAGDASGGPAATDRSG